MSLIKESLLQLLKNDNIAYKLYEHPAVFTVEEAARYCSHIPGVHVKNLFLRNKKKSQYFLVTVRDEKRVDLFALGDLLNVGRLSFASDQDLIKILGVMPGSVTPFAILNDAMNQVQIFIDKDLAENLYISVHPLENTSTVNLKTADVIAFIENHNERSVNWIAVPAHKSDGVQKNE